MQRTVLPVAMGFGLAVLLAIALTGCSQAMSNGDPDGAADLAAGDLGGGPGDLAKGDLAPGAPSQAGSTLTANPMKLVADGKSQTMLTVTALDDLGTPVPGVMVTVA